MKESLEALTPAIDAVKEYRNDSLTDDMVQKINTYRETVLSTMVAVSADIASECLYHYEDKMQDIEEDEYFKKTQKYADRFDFSFNFWASKAKRIVKHIQKMISTATEAHMRYQDH